MVVQLGNSPPAFDVAAGNMANKHKFDFKICELNIAGGDESSKAEYTEDVKTCFKRCSRLAEVDKCRIESEGGAYVAKIRIRVRNSLSGSTDNVTLDSAIKELCQGLIAAGKGKRARVDVLTDRSVWGITPISSMFQTYWTASFFDDILTNGPGRVESFAQASMRESRQYWVPPLMVLGIATLFKMPETFHFMQSMLGKTIDSRYDLNGLVEKASPTMMMVFQALSICESQPASTKSLDHVRDNFENSITMFKDNLDTVLERMSTIDGNTAPTLLCDLEWMHEACSGLCGMSMSAAALFTRKREFLVEVLKARRKSHEATATAFASATASALTAVSSLKNNIDAARAGADTANVANAGSLTTGSFTCTARNITASSAKAFTLTAGASRSDAARASPLPTVWAGASMIAGPAAYGMMTMYSAWRGWQNYSEVRKYDQEIVRATEVGDICHAAWNKAFLMNLALNWFRLHEGEHPTDAHFDNPQLQAAWEHFAEWYRAKISSGNDQNTKPVLLMGVWLQSEVDVLKGKRALLQ